MELAKSDEFWFQGYKKGLEDALKQLRIVNNPFSVKPVDRILLDKVEKKINALLEKLK